MIWHFQMGGGSFQSVKDAQSTNGSPPNHFVFGHIRGFRLLRSFFRMKIVYFCNLTSYPWRGFAKHKVLPPSCCNKDGGALAVMCVMVLDIFL